MTPHEVVLRCLHEPCVVAEKEFVTGARVQLVESAEKVAERRRLTIGEREISILLELGDVAEACSGSILESDALDFDNDEEQSEPGSFKFILFLLPKPVFKKYASQNGVSAFSDELINDRLCDDMLLHLACAADELLREDMSSDFEYALGAILQAVCACLVRSSHPTGGIQHKGGLTRLQLMRAQCKMMENLSGGIKLREIAAECLMSPSHFVRAFKATVGCSPVRWLSEQRITEAKQLLLSNTMPLKMVAARCGYTDQAAFTRIFHRRTGSTPSNWRRSRMTV